MNATTKEGHAEQGSEGLLTKDELAPLLHCCIRTVDDWMRKGRIPFMKVGKTVRFRYSDVLSKLNEYRVN